MRVELGDERVGVSGSGANLAYVLLSGPFGPAMAGRAQTSLNLLLFLAAALEGLRR